MRNATSKYLFNFTNELPLVGLWGVANGDKLLSLGVIQYDVACGAWLDEVTLNTPVVNVAVAVHVAGSESLGFTDSVTPTGAILETTDSSPSTGAVVGGIIGAVILAAIVVILLVLFGVIPSEIAYIQKIRSKFQGLIRAQITEPQ